MSPLVAPDVPAGVPVLADPDAAGDPDDVSPDDVPEPDEPGSVPVFDPRSFEPLDDGDVELPVPECDVFPLELPL